MQAATALQVELEGGAQVWLADVGCGSAGAHVDKWYEPAAGREVVTDMGAQADEVRTFRRELVSTEQISQQFPISAIPVSLADNVRKNPSIIHDPNDPI